MPKEVFQINLGKHKILVPCVLGALSYADFLLYTKATSDLQKLEIFSGTNLAELVATEAHMTNVIGMIANFDQLVLEFLRGNRQPEDKINVTVLGKELKFNKELGKLAYWPMTEVKEIVKKMGSEPFNDYEHYGQLVGHYLYSKYQPHDEQKANEFTDEVVMNMPFTDVIKLGDFFFVHSAPYLAAEAKILTSEPDEDEIAAGIDIFSKYGDINVLESLSLKYNTTWEEVKRWSFDQVLTMRRLSNDKSIFEKALWKLKNPKLNQ